MGLLDFKIDVVFARLEADFSDQPPSIHTVPNHQVSLQCPTDGYPCSSKHVPYAWLNSHSNKGRTHSVLARAAWNVSASVGAVM